MPYEVEYLRNGVKDIFLTQDKSRAEEFAVKYKGVVWELARVYQWPVQQLEPLSMTNGEESSRKE